MAPDIQALPFPDVSRVVVELSDLEETIALVQGCVARNAFLGPVAVLINRSSHSEKQLGNRSY